MLHPVETELQRRGWNHTELAKRSGVCRSTIASVLGGTNDNRQNFSTKAAKQIHEALEGEVPLEDLLFWRPVKQKGARR